MIRTARSTPSIISERYRSGSITCSSSIARRVRHAGFGEAFFTEEATVAAAAGAALRVGVVAAVGHGVVDAEVEAAADDLGFGEVDEGGVDFETFARGDTRDGVAGLSFAVAV